MTPDEWAEIKNPTCSLCKMPVTFNFTKDSAEHAELADAAACSLFFGDDAARNVEGDQ